MNAKHILPRPKKDVVKNKTPIQLTADAVSFPCGKDINNLNKFVMDALSHILYVNDTNIVCGEVEKYLQPTSWKMSAGWSWSS
jgi:Holliday junction resolvase RusA-like endonuclease